MFRDANAIMNWNLQNQAAAEHVPLWESEPHLQAPCSTRSQEHVQQYEVGSNQSSWAILHTPLAHGSMPLEVLLHKLAAMPLLWVTSQEYQGALPSLLRWLQSLWRAFGLHQLPQPVILRRINLLVSSDLKFISPIKSYKNFLYILEQSAFHNSTNFPSFIVFSLLFPSMLLELRTCAKRF